MSAIGRRFGLTLRRQSSSAGKNGDSKANHSRAPTSISTASSETMVASISKSFETIKQILENDAPILLDPATIASVIDFVRHKDAIDDRKMFLEHILMLLAKTPENTSLSKMMTNAVVELLYNDLTHPPATFVSNKYAYRQPDGGYNNVTLPDLGRAGTPYSRSVQQIHPLPAHMLPDPGLLFDTLLKREKFEPHPAGLSSLMFAWAALVIHSVFRTSHEDWTINETSSYVDLSPLYGVNEDELKSVRLTDKRGKLTGYGLLKPDTFAEDRLLLLPPAVSALLILFNRNHNYIAKKLFEINERGWTRPDDPTEYANLSEDERDKKVKALDEEVFGTARLINCAWFANVVFSDYFSAILGFVRKGIKWTLLPFDSIRKDDHSFFERGAGNSCSVEFNCLYRWHATTSEPDEKWLATAFSKFFSGTGMKPEDVTPNVFSKAADKFDKKERTDGVETWTFGTLTRTADKTFADEDLAKVLQDATSAPAARFGARGSPPIMKLNEIMGIEQSRRWGVCSLNDFRKFLGLKPYATFEEWNDDKEVAEAASRLYYGDINNLELYVGLQAEQTKPVQDGTGLCPSYTVTRAILADAIALTRGDRFYTSDMTPHNYTSWGLHDCSRDENNPGFGSMLGRLLLRTLPNQYASDSAYTWFPLMYPQKMSEYARDLKVHDQYTWDRPPAAMPTITVNDYATIGRVLGDTKDFTPTYAERAQKIISRQGFFTAYGQTDEGMKDQNAVLDLLTSANPASEVAGRFHDIITELINRESYFLSGKQRKNIDISAVLKAVPLTWVCEDIAGIPLKTVQHPDGKWTEIELFNMIADIYQFIFLGTDPAKEMNDKARVKKQAQEILAVIQKNVKESAQKLAFNQVLNLMSSHRKNQKVTDFLGKLAKKERPVEEIANSIFSVLITATAELSQAMINMVNLYLEKDYTEERTQIQSKDVSNNVLLPGFAREAMRLDPPFAGVYREARSAQLLGDHSVAANQKIFLNIAQANKDSSIFANPTKIDPRRAEQLYLPGDGINKFFGSSFVNQILGEVLYTVLTLPRLARSPGQSGLLKRFPFKEGASDHYQYLDKNMDTTPWATSLILQFDASS